MNSPFDEMHAAQDAVRLHYRDYARWLDRSIEDVADLLSPYPASGMSFHPVSTRVNAVKNDDASIIDPVEVAPANEASAAPADSEEELPTQASLF